MTRHIIAMILALSSPIALAQPASTGHTDPATNSDPAPQSSPSKPLLTITLDTSESPDLAEWAQKSKDLCLEWYPKLLAALPSDGFTPPDSLRIVFRRKLAAPAMTGGGVMSINAPYVEGNRNDLGMVIHELMHVVQSYPGQKENMGWLTEGIADYVRFWIYEPKTPQSPIDKQHASYRDAYRTTAAFLGYLTETHDKDIVRKLNAKLRKGEGEAALFQQMLGKSVDDLWKEFIDFGAPSSPAALAEAIKAHQAKPAEDKPSNPNQPAPK